VSGLPVKGGLGGAVVSATAAEDPGVDGRENSIDAGSDVGDGSGGGGRSPRPVRVALGLSGEVRGGLSVRGRGGGGRGRGGSVGRI